MDGYEVKMGIIDSIPVISAIGYFEKLAGAKVKEEAERLMQGGNVHLVLDLSQCSVLASPGVAVLIEISIAAIDTYGGKLIVCGLDKLKERVLRMVLLQDTSDLVPTVAEAVARAKQLKS